MENCLLSQKPFEFWENINQIQNYGSSKLGARNILNLAVKFFENGSEITKNLASQKSLYVAQYI